MSIDSIIDAYQLRNVTVSPDILLLDPKNPRIILKTSRPADYTLQQLASDEVQDYILSVIDKAEFHLSELIESIRDIGFLDQGNRMIIEHVNGTDKFLVLDGNRRLTAIKHLLSNPSALSPRILESIESFRAYELVLTDTGKYSRDEVIFKLLGMLHLKGQLEWGAMERALYIYQAYASELNKHWRLDEPIYDVDCSSACAKTLGMKPQEVRNELAIYSIYSQLKNEGCPVKEEHYTLLNMAVRTQGMNYDYFGFNLYALKFSQKGLERFNNLCLERNRPIHNPGDFKKVAKIHKKGFMRDMELLENGGSSLDDIVEIVENRLVKHPFLDELRKIEKKMSSLRLIEPARIKQEVHLVERIRDMASQILRILH